MGDARLYFLDTPPEDMLGLRLTVRRRDADRTRPVLEVESLTQWGAFLRTIRRGGTELQAIEAASAARAPQGARLGREAA